MGINGKLFEMMNKSINFTEGRLTYSMIDASYLSLFGQFEIAPPATPLYASASGTQKSTYMFFCDQSAEYSNGDAAHILG
jgi:hypothetical protein